MFKVFSILVVLAISANAAPNQNFFFSPYSNRLVPLQAQMPTEVKREMTMPTMPSMPSMPSMPFQKKDSFEAMPRMPVQKKDSFEAMPRMPVQKKDSFQAMPEMPAQKRSFASLTDSSSMMPFSRRVPEPTVFKENYCQGQAPESKLPFPDNHNKFIVCHLGETFDIMSCPRHTVFNVHSQHCENSLRKPKGCSSNPCQNSGRCVDTAFGQFTCECPSGFKGRTCEARTTCGGNECGPNGVCMQLPVGSPADHFCMCDEGMTYGLTCNAQDVERNPCMTNEADLHSFPVSHNRALFLQCEGHIPHLKFCAYPLVYSHETQMCNWE